MGALFFNYSVFPDPKVSTKFFEYGWRHPLSEYGFSYERYAALSDASIFNTPVAVTKVATGVRLYDLFVERIDRDTAYYQNPIPTKLSYKSRDFRYHQYSFVTRPLTVIPTEMERINLLYDNQTSYENCRFEIDRINNDNVIKFLRERCTIPDKIVFEHQPFFIPPVIQHKNIVELSMEVIPYESKTMELEQHEVINRPLPYFSIRLNDTRTINRTDRYVMNRGEMITIDHTNHPRSMVLHFRLRAKRTEAGWEIYKDEWSVRIHDDSLQMLEQDFAWVYDYRTVNVIRHFIMDRDRWGMWLHDDDIASPTRKDMNSVGLNILGTPDRKDIISDSTFLGGTPDKRELIFDSTFLGGAPEGRDMNIASSGLHGQFRKDSNILTSGLNAARADYNTNFYSNPLAFKELYKIHLFADIPSGKRGTQGYLGLIFDPNEYLGLPKDKILDYYQNVHTDVVNEKGYVQDYDRFGAVLPRKSHTEDQVSGFMYGRETSVVNQLASGVKSIESSKASVFKDLDGVVKTDRFISSDNGYGVKKRISPSYTLDLTAFAVHEDKYILVLDGFSLASNPENTFTTEGLWTSNLSKHVSSQENSVFGIKETQEAIMDTSPDFCTKPHKSSGILGYDLHGVKSKAEAFVSQGVSGKAKRKKGMKQESVSAKHDRKSLADLEKPLTAYKDGSSFVIYDSISARLKKKPLSSDIDNGLQVTHKAKDFTIFDLFVAITKKRHGIDIWPNQDTVEKSRHSFVLFDNDTIIQKVRHSFVIDDFATNIYKDRKEINLELAIIWACSKVRHSIVLPDWGFGIYKERKDLFFDNSLEPAHKKRHPMEVISSIEGAIKSLYPVAVSHYLKYPNWEKLGGFIVPISKVRHQAMIDYVNEFATKRFRDVMVTEGDFATVIAKPIMLNVDVSLDKIPKNAYLDYLNEMLVKYKLKATIEDGIFGFKAPHNVHIQYVDLWSYLEKKKVQIDYDDVGKWGSKVPGQVMVFSPIFAEKLRLEAYVFGDEWLDKSPNLCYYSYDVWGWKKKNQAFLDPGYMAGQMPKEVQVGDQLFGSKPDRMAMLHFGSFTERGVNRAWYEDGIFSERLIKSSDIFQQLEWGFKDAHKCDLHPNDFGNWAWVYETPDPFQYDKYGIDELLLPERDTQYEKFEDLIFDKEHIRPRHAIKEISDTEWIARLPIRHPVKNHADVGKVYEDSAYKWENYFGIQTSVVHDMFLKYYRIWEKNMFKFSTMTMQQAGNLMLEYLWTWIPLYYPLDQIEQAYRVFRLIRWYTECAIINNSQYIISYQYADMKWPRVDEKTGTVIDEVCRIPSDLQEYDPTNVIDNSNDTMYSLTGQGAYCLKINPIYYGSNDAWVTFRIENKRNTTIKFDLYNEVGSVNIYLNDRLIESLTAHGHHKLAYNIQYTGDVNEFKIEKKAPDTDAKFVIGNICIGMQDFKDLNITFDPTLRAGNKPLNEVAQKLIEFAALHDRKDIAYHEMLTKNLGVSEVYKMLEKYWQLHHENKWKGKRLTIKQV